METVMTGFRVEEGHVEYGFRAANGELNLSRSAITAIERAGRRGITEIYSFIVRPDGSVEQEYKINLRALPGQ